MENNPIDYRFITKIELERKEPQRRFNGNSLLDKVMESFPDIKDRYLNAYNAYIHRELQPEPSFETFITEVYNPILATSAVINEVSKLRKPNPVAFNLDAIKLIIRSMNNHSEETEDQSEGLDLTTQLVQKAMEYVELTDEEFFRYKMYNVCSIQLAKMEQDPTYDLAVISQQRRNVHSILSSLQPEGTFRL